MLKGAIDHITTKTISGWIYSEAETVRDKRVLAFVDGVCVGAGEVKTFRQDLLDAGLGDGYFGFHFGISPPHPRDAFRAYVKLDGSDLALVPSDCRVINVEDAKPNVSRASKSAESIEWMRQRGWLEQPELDFLKFFLQFGVYDKSLRLSKKDAEAVGIDTLDPYHEARRLFELLLFQPLKIEAQQFASCAALAVSARELASRLAEPAVAIFSKKRGTILLVEGSHIDDAVEGDAGLAGAIEYSFGPDRLLMLNLRSIFGANPKARDGEIQVFFPTSTP